MWWLAIPLIGLVGKAVYDAVTDEDEIPPPRSFPPKKIKTHTILELNLVRLGDQVRSHSGYKIAILGQPGAGKSSLLKKMTNSKVKPLPVIGAQTDATDWSRDVACNLLSVYENYSFADVPGYDTWSHPLKAFSSYFPFRYFDAYIFVVHGKLHSSDEDVFRLIAGSGRKICIARSFCDNIESDDIKSVENDIRTRLSCSDSAPILFFSNRTGTGVDSVFDSVRH
ncbi:MAG: GTPase [Candidatus Accumulibacter sp. UW25]|jgi:predicted GTPase